MPPTDIQAEGDAAAASIGSTDLWHRLPHEERERIVTDAGAWRVGLADSLLRAGYGDADSYLEAAAAAEAERIAEAGRTAATITGIHSDTEDAPAAGMNIRTARELFASVPDETAWRVHGLIPDNGITELDGRAKSAGKTTFLAHLSRAVLDGSAFLGRSTRQGPVVLLSEQPIASLRASLAAAGLTDREDLWILTWGEAMGRPWHAVAEAAMEVCTRVKAGLLAVDTLPQFAAMRGDSENDSGAALAAIEPLQRAANAGLAVLVVRHDRKGSGEVGESARGSTAFGGAVDVILQLRRGTADERSTIRYLGALSRFPETPSELVVELTDAGYVAIGDAAGYAAAEAKAKVLAAVDGEGLSRDEIAKAVGISGERLTKALTELVAEGDLTRQGRGVKNDPQRFRRQLSIHSGGPPHYVGGRLLNDIEPAGALAGPDEDDYPPSARDQT